jgi:hypothetical protein
LPEYNNTNKRKIDRSRKTMMVALQALDLPGLKFMDEIQSNSNP